MCEISEPPALKKIIQTLYCLFDSLDNGHVFD